LSICTVRQIYKKFVRKSLEILAGGVIPSRPLREAGLWPAGWLAGWLAGGQAIKMYG